MSLFKRTVVFSAIVLSLSFSAEAYNYLNIHPSTGEPLHWDSSQPIRYYLDPGNAGRFSNGQILMLLQTLMQVWGEASSNADVPRFEFAGYLPEDVNGTNYQKYVTKIPCYEDDLDACATEAQRNLQTVIILDEDGSVISGAGLCPFTNCGAVAGPRVFGGNGNNPSFIKQGIVVIRPVGEDVKVSAFAGVILHELGHLLGLAHPSVNQQVFIDNIEEDYRFFPTMMAGISGATNKLEVTLNPDDIAGIATLYPSNTSSQETATIKGQIFKSDLSPMMHVNVIARNIQDPLCKAYSFLSGRVCPPGTVADSLNSESCGDLSIPAIIDVSDFVISSIPPGTYTLEVEEVADENLAFSLAPGLVDPFIYGDAEFWNENDAANEPNTDFTEITLAAGEIRDNIDIVLNRNEVTDDRIKYLPLSILFAGSGTDCPTSPPVNYAELIGVDESEPDVPDPTPSGGGSSSGCSLLVNN